ncbi:MAG TPA: hypothetical protein DCS42_05430 [Nitrospiraceae bacterium]|nr:hypothetical protein [Nitrospiraceae bacterium]
MGKTLDQLGKEFERADRIHETSLDEARQINAAAARLYVQELRPDMDVITYDNEDFGRLDFN